MGGLSLAGVAVLFPAESRSEDSAVALPRSEFSLGIWTFNCGRLDGSEPLFVRKTGLMSGAEEIDWVRAGSVAALKGAGLAAGKSSAPSSFTD